MLLLPQGRTCPASDNNAACRRSLLVSFHPVRLASLQAGLALSRQHPTTNHAATWDTKILSGVPGPTSAYPRMHRPPDTPARLSGWLWRFERSLSMSMCSGRHQGPAVPIFFHCFRPKIASEACCRHSNERWTVEPISQGEDHLHQTWKLAAGAYLGQSQSLMQVAHCKRPWRRPLLAVWVRNQ